MLCVVFDFASIYFFDGNRFEIDPFQAPDIDRPSIEGLRTFENFFRRWIAWASEREDATRGTKEIFRRFASPLIQNKIFPWGKQI
jgi:hypothetical protein